MGHVMSGEKYDRMRERAEKAEARVAELELGILRLIWANDGTTAERTDIAWRDLRRLVDGKEKKA